MADRTVGYQSDGTPYTYATPAAAWTAANAGDRVLCHYSDAKQHLVYTSSFNNAQLTAKLVGIESGLTGERRVRIYCNGTGSAADFVYFHGDFSGVGDVAFRDIVFLNQQGAGVADVCIYYNDTGGSSGGSRLFERCEITGPFAAGIQTVGNHSDVIIRNNLIRDCLSYALNIDGAGVKALGNTCIGNGTYGIHPNDLAVTVKNNVCLNWGEDFRKVGGAVVASNNCSSDATAPGANSLTNQRMSDMYFWRDHANGFYPDDLRILTDSNLAGAGIADADMSEDCEQVARPDPPSMGWHEATTTPFGVTHPAEAAVLDTESYIDWDGAASPTLDPDYLLTDAGGNWTKADKTKVLTGNDFGIDGTSEEAELSPDFPDEGNVTEDDTVNGNPGTYHEAAVGEVKLAVTFGAAEGLTGTLESTDPGVANVLAPTAYKIESVGKVGTYAPDFPDEGNTLNDDTTNGEAGTYVPLAEEYGKGGETWGEDGTEFTGTYSGPGSPTLPTLAVADQQDLTGATATVSGGDATATHTIKYAIYGSTSWTEGGDRTGNGEVDLAITTPGYYWAICEAEENDSYVTTPPAAFQVTAGTESMLKQIMDAVAAELNGLSLTDSDDTSISATVEIPPDFDSVTTACIKVFPDTAPLDAAPGTVNRGTYKINVALCQEATTSSQENNLMRNREKIQDRLVGSRLSALTSACCLAMAEPAAANLEWLWNNWRWVSTQTFEFTRHRART